MIEADFISRPYTSEIQGGQVTWQAPSNIALVKYWGKKENQIPANPSISFTLEECATKTTLLFSKLKAPISEFSFDISLDGKPKDDFKPKIETFFKRAEKYLPFLKEYHFNIETSNSFPHSSGIASSASGMSALALCLVDLERQLNLEMTDDFFNRKASFLARLGSGSASRSIAGTLVQWGNHADIPGSSDLYGIKYPLEVHPVYKNYCDTILLVDRGQKQVSSSVGHNLMYDHQFAEQRFDQAHKNLSKLRAILAEGNLDDFIEVVESEALTLHAMMMTGQPYFILMRPATLEIINKIWAFRKISKTHLCFTLDAGANVHLLFPEFEKAQIEQFIKDELVAHCEKGQYITDRIGSGAVKL